MIRGLLMVPAATGLMVWAVARAEDGEPDTTAIASMGFVVASKANVSGSVGIRYLRPSEPGICSEAFRPEVSARLPPAILEAMDQARRVEGSVHEELSGETAVYRLEWPGGRPAGTLYATKMSAESGQVLGAYLAGIASDCGAHKATDLRFLAGMVHYQILSECSEVSVREAVQVARSIDTVLHPQWLVLSPCGTTSPVDQGFASAAGIRGALGFTITVASP